MIANHQDNSGTPAARFDWLMNELETRFPSKHPLDSSRVHELDYLMAIDAVIRDSQELNALKNQLLNIFTGE